jgi:hypothetical protein
LASASESRAPAAFVPVAVIEGRAIATRPMASAIEIDVAGAVVRVRSGADIGLLSAVLRAVKNA